MSGFSFTPDPSLTLPRADVVRRWCELCVAFCLPWISFFFVRGTGTILLLPIVIAIICYFLSPRPNKEKNKFSTVPLILALLFSAITAGSLLYSADAGYALKLFVTTMLPLALVLFFALIPPLAPSRQLIGLLTSGTVFAILLGISQFLMQNSFIGLIGQKDPQSWTIDLNRGLVVLTLVFIPVLAALITEARSVLSLPVLRLLFVFLIAALLFLGSSETAQLSALAGLGVFVCLGFFPKQTVLLLSIGLALIIILLVSLPFAFPLLDQFLVKASPVWDASSSLARVEIWRMAIEKIHDSLWLGHGFEATRFIDFGYQPQNTVMPKSGQIMHPHNNILQIWLEFGLLGISWAVAALLYAAFALIKVNPAGQRILASLIAALFVISLTGYNMWQGWLFCAAILVFALSLRASEADALACPPMSARRE